MVITMLPVAWFVHHLLQGTMPPQHIRPLAMVLMTTAAVAFAIGALVPSWYRDPRRTPPTPQLAAVPAGATAS